MQTKYIEIQKFFEIQKNTRLTIFFFFEKQKFKYSEINMYVCIFFMYYKKNNIIFKKKCFKKTSRKKTKKKK